MSKLINFNILNTFRYNLSGYLKMSCNTAMEQCKINTNKAKEAIAELKNEMAFINKEYNNILSRQLLEENAKLVAAVEEAKKRLISLEIKNGIQQVPLPLDSQVKSSNIESTEESPKVEVKTSETEVSVKKEVKPKKEKKAKEPKEQTADAPIDVGRLDLRIGKVEDINRHPDADTLYVLKINVGEEKPRTVCSGLVNNIQIDELRNIYLVVLCNLKPVKMRGITSEAMVMCACADNTVEVLIPPKGVAVGDLVHCDGYTRRPDSVMNPKKKIFETVVPDLRTNDQQQACYKSTPLMVPDKGVCMSKTLKNTQIK